MATAPATDPPDSYPAASSPSRPSTEELVARAVAPVNPAFLLPPPVREAPKEEGKAGGGGVTAGKKSKRQLKRERQQEKKSTCHLCIEVGKSGNVDSCKYGASCRFSHDISAYLARPWIFTEIKEQKHWDITSGERLNILKDFVHFGLEHWGSDSKGVETTRHFLLEWLSYTCRYIPVGLLDVIPQRLNWRPPSYYRRDDLETLMASDSAADCIRISEMLLGKVPEGFTFAPKHKSNAYDRAENG